MSEPVRNSNNIVQTGAVNLLDSDEYKNRQGDLCVPIGRAGDGTIVIKDIQKLTHVLICGSTGTGKTSFVQTLLSIAVINTRYDRFKFFVFDTNKIEYKAFSGTSQMLMPVIGDPKRLAGALNWLNMELQTRIRSIADMGCRDIQSYNDVCISNGKGQLPLIFIVIDDFSTVSGEEDILNGTIKIAQNGRIAGIHLILVASIITARKLPKDLLSCIPCRISFRVSSKAESRIALGQTGAETLNVPGEMIFKNLGEYICCQCAYAEYQNIEKFIKTGVDAQMATFSKMDHTLREVFHNAGIEYEPDSRKEFGREGSVIGQTEDLDEYVIEAGKLVLERNKASVGMIQRAFKIGFNRAARIMDQLSDLGLVGEAQGAVPRKILLTADEWESVVKKL